MSVAPAYKGHLATTNAGLTPIPANVPTSGGPATDDWMLAVIHTTATGGVTHNTAAPSGSGWVQILAPSLLSSRILQIYAKRRASTDPTSWTFTQEKTGTALADVIWGSGGLADIGTWLKGAFSKGANLTTQTTPGISGTVTNSLALSIQAEATSATETDVMTVDAPFTKLYWTIVTGSGPVNSLLIASRTMSADGATGDATSRAWPNQTGNRGSFMLVIPPAADATPAPVAKLAATVSDGAGKPIAAGLTIWDGSKELAIAKVEPVHSGTFVPDLDRAARVWWMTHRGGSIDYQEHSARGYVESAVRHADVMEFSLGRTSDGVFFGLHDATLNRTTSGLAANYLASAHTWAEISALQQDLANRGDTRFTTQPYMRLDEFVAQWSPSHTLMFDPKLINTAGRQALYPILQQIPRYQERVLGKFFHTGTTIADEFHAIGCKAWGYAYPEAITGLTTGGAATTDPLLSATAAKWDYLGMEWNASDAVWAETLRIAAGKIVIGHIVATVAQANEAVRKGARALQVSGVRDVSTAY